MTLLNRFSSREKLLFYSGMLVIVGIIAYIVIIEPIWTEWQDLNKTIFTKQAQLLKNLKILSQKEQIARLYDKYAENIKMKGSVEEETAVILREIENIARSSKTYITDIKPHKVKDMEFYKEYYIELEADGNITNLAKFIYGLQSSEQILKVRHLRLNAKAGGGDVLKAYMIITKILIP